MCFFKSPQQNEKRMKTKSKKGKFFNSPFKFKPKKLARRGMDKKFEFFMS